MAENFERQGEQEENLVLSFYYDEESPSGVGFETVEILSENKETLCMAMDIAAKISDSLPDEAKEIMHREKIPLFRIYTDDKGLWGELCNTEELELDQEMRELLDKITEDLVRAAQ